MKRIFTAAITTAAASALAASSFDPVQATTFPSLTLIYTAAGVTDFEATPTIGTSVICVNQSGQTATVRWRFLNNLGTDVGARNESVDNGEVVVVATGNGTYAYGGLLVSVASDFLGRVAVYSTQSAVFCTAAVASSSAPDAGNSLHMVRFNPHPGTVE